jgi:hypothetical protein
MDFLKKATESGGANDQQSGGNGQQGTNDSNDIGSKLMGSFNNLAGGGKRGEQNEDGLDKGMPHCATMSKS